MRKCTNTVPFSHPPSRTYPITVHSSRLEEEGSRKLTPTRNAMPQSMPRVEQPANRLRLSHILTTHVKVQRFRARLQNQGRPRHRSHRSRRTDRAQAQARITPKDQTEIDAEKRKERRQQKSHEVHLGEGANTGAQLPAKEDPKLGGSQDAGQLSENRTLAEKPKSSCLRRGPNVGDGRRWHRQKRKDCEQSKTLDGGLSRPRE